MIKLQDKINFDIQDSCPLPGRTTATGVLSVVHQQECDHRSLARSAACMDSPEAMSEAFLRDEITAHIRKAVFGDIITAIGAGNQELLEWIRANAHRPTFQSELCSKIVEFTEGLTELTR